MQEKPMPNTQTVAEPRPVTRTNEQSRLNIDDFVRIYDPNTQQVMVEKRS